MRAPELRAALAALLLFCGLAAFGARFHPVEEAGTAERDGYVAQAELILRGELPRDPYRPLLYPLLIAGTAKLGVPPFAAARLLSNLAAAALAWLAWAFGRRLAGPTAGAWAFALAAVNPNLWILGQHASTDMLFAALAAAALYAGCAHLEEPGLRTALAAGAFLGLAAFTRANAMFLLPALLVAVWPPPLAPPPQSGRGEKDPAPEGIPEGTGRGRPLPLRGGGSGRGSRSRHLFGFLAMTLLVLLPHWALRAAVFGSPFYDENWKNLAWKLHGYPDWSYLERVPYGSGLEILRAEPWAVVRGGFEELARFFAGGGMPQLFGTWAQVLLLAVGIAVALRQRSRTALWLLAAGGLFLGAIAFAFFTWGRLLLLLLPLGCGLSFVPWKTPGRAAHAVAFALVALLAVKTFGFRLPAFVERHPVHEIALLRRLDATLPPGAALAGTSPFLGRYLDRPYVDLPDAFGREITEPSLWYAKVEPVLHQAGVAYLVAGPVDLRDRPRSLLSDRPPVPWLQPAGGEGGVVVWRVGTPAGLRKP